MVEGLFSSLVVLAVTSSFLGMLYKEGEGVKQDLAEARKWWSKAAESEADAVYNLGRLELEATPSDPLKAVSLFQKASAMGSSLAMHNLAVAHIKGVGVPKDESEAVRWFELAGNEDAMLHIHDILLKSDQTKALIWLRRAAEAGQVTACRKMAQRELDTGGGIAAASRWLSKAASRGDREAWVALQKLRAQAQPGGRPDL